MSFYGYHGFLEEERKLGQEFKVNLELYLPLGKAGKSDDLSKTIDYAKIYQDTNKIIKGNPVLLLEALAEKIANTVLLYQQVEAVRVSVIKTKPPLPGLMEGIEVCIFRERK
ncbi:MAG: dihydroneopterin aldolase [Dethiobacter sp.]|nr:MAG: dihydroneopterin aldolase [Dethiobacter sp.]